jgi:phage recombination protein Bet
MTTTAMVPAAQPTALATRGATYNREQTDLIKRTIARGATDDELALFIATANRLRLDPFARQIFAIKRYDPETKTDGMTTHVSIDGLRLIADRTGEYLPAPELPEFAYNAKGEVVSCTVTVLKWRREAWHRVPACVYFDEYAQTKRDGNLNKNWATKPHVMLGKAAEAAAIRKAFPNETCGVYVPEEFGDDDETPAASTAKAAPPVPSPVQSAKAAAIAATAKPAAPKPAPAKQAQAPAGQSGKVDADDVDRFFGSPSPANAAPIVTSAAAPTATGEIHPDAPDAEVIDDGTPPSVAELCAHIKGAANAADLARFLPAAQGVAEAWKPHTMSEYIGRLIVLMRDAPTSAERDACAAGVATLTLTPEEHERALVAYKTGKAAGAVKK